MRESALELGRCGARLILIGRNRERLEETTRLAEGDSMELLALDVENVSEIQEKTLESFRKVGRIYGLCHAAGTVVTRPLSSTSPEIHQ